MGRKKEKSRKIVLDWKNSSLRVLEDGKTREKRFEFDE